MTTCRSIRSRDGVRGFSLMEILIVIAILGVLFSVIMPAVNEARDRAQVAAVVMELDALKTVFHQLYDDTSYYPNGDTSYCRDTASIPNNEIDLSINNAGLLANGLGWSNWNGPYVPDVIDEWGTPYYLDEDYQCLAATEGCRGIADTGTDSSVIVSCGPNRALNNGSCAYDDDNIVYRLCD